MILKETCSDTPAAGPGGISNVISTTVPETATPVTNAPPATKADKTPVNISGIGSTLIDRNNVPAIIVGQEIANLAVKYNGFKYVYGASSPSVGFDCSGLVSYVYNQFGYKLPRTAYYQSQEGTKVAKSGPKAG